MDKLDRPHVVIVGAGFAGLACAQALARSPCRVTVLDRNNYHLFQPLLYQVATGFLQAEDIAMPLRSLLKPHRGLRFRQATVTGITPERHQVLTLDDEPMPYDILVLACGSVTQFHGIDPGEGGYDLKTLSGALCLHDHVIDSLEHAARENDRQLRQAWLTYVVVGGGPTGTEFAGALADLARGMVRRDYPEIGADALRILLLQSGPSILPAFAAPLRDEAARVLTRRGVLIRTGMRVQNWRAGHVTLENGETIAARTLVWAAGVTSPSWTRLLPLTHTPEGRLEVNTDFCVASHPEIFVVGDLAGHPAHLPQVAAAALQAGSYVGDLLRRRLLGRRAPAAFRYRDRGSMAAVGRLAAVAEIKPLGLNLKGAPAWFAWLALHLFYLVGFRNRLAALMAWGYDYVRPNSVNRLSLTHTSRTETR